MKYTRELDKMKKLYASVLTIPESEALRQSFIELHYRSGMSIRTMATYIGCHFTTAYAWKRKYGVERTAFTYGRYIRYDVRTKCIILKRIIDGEDINVISAEVHVLVPTINKWMDQYGSRVDEYIDNMPDGVPYLVKNKLHVYGDENIRNVALMLKRQREELETKLYTQHEGL
jgi:hypothetical protein